MRQPVFVILISVLALLGMPFSSAYADEVGSPAVVLKTTTLLAGPGARYPEVASAVSQSQDVTVVRCSERWCLIGGTNGWMSIDDLSFGNFERRPFHGTVSDIGRGGPGTICFYDGTNYSGASVCLDSGHVARDLLLLGWDNRISSVSIEGAVSVNLCRDREFTSYCELIAESQPNVNRLLNNAASSWQVW